MIHQGQEESHEISHQTLTQPAILIPQYIVARKNMMQQPEKLYTLQLIVYWISKESKQKWFSINRT